MSSTINNHFMCLSVSNTNTACCDLSVNTSTRWASLGASRLSKPLSQEIILCMSSDGCFATEENDIHCSRCHRTVSFKDTENYLTNFDSNRHALHNDSCEMKYGINNTKQNSMQRQLYGFVTGYFITMFGPMIDNGLEGADCNPSLMDVSPLMTRICYPYVPNIILAIEIGIVLYMLANISRGEANIHNANVADTDNLINVTDTNNLVNAIDTNVTTTKITYYEIEIDDFETLKKIGEHKDYPSDVHYRLTSNLVGNNSIYPIIKKFSGSIDGAGYTISEHSGCLIQKLENHGIVGNIVFNNSKNIDAFCSPLVANTITDHAMLKNIRVSNYEAHITQLFGELSIFAGNLYDWARIEDCSVIDSHITLTSKHSNFAFFALNMFDSSSVTNNAIINVIIYAEKYGKKIGSVLHMMDQSRISKITAIGCIFNLKSKMVHSTIGAVLQENYSQSSAILAINSDIKLLDSLGYFGVGVGSLNVGLLDVNSESDVLTQNNMAIGCNLTGTNRENYIAVGAGIASRGQIHNNVAVNSYLKITNNRASTAIGVGKVKEMFRVNECNNNIVIGTKIEVWGTTEAYFRVGIGNKPDSLLRNDTMIDSTILIRGKLVELGYSGRFDIDRSTLCRGLAYPISDLLNDNCSLDQQALNSYVNQITTWYTTALDIGRVVKNKVPKITESVMMTGTLPNSGSVTTSGVSSLVLTGTLPNSGSVTTSGASSLSLTEILLISAVSTMTISWIARSYCDAYQNKGKRGLALIAHPIRAFTHCFNGSATAEMPVTYSVNNESIENLFSAEGGSVHSIDSADSHSLIFTDDDDPPPIYSSEPNSCQVDRFLSS